jgi:hypothetical protein
MPRRSGEKSKLIRSLPAWMSAKEVVEEAGRRGVKLSTNLVYVVRSTSRTTGKRAAHSRSAARVARAPRGRPPAIRELIARLEDAGDSLRAARGVLERLASFGG